MASPPGLLPVGLVCLIGVRTVVIDALQPVVVGLLRDPKPPLVIWLATRDCGSRAAVCFLGASAFWGAPGRRLSLEPRRQAPARAAQLIHPNQGKCDHVRLSDDIKSSTPYCTYSQRHAFLGP